MSTVSVNVRRVGEPFQTGESVTPGRAELLADLARARTLATWLDAQFEVAGVKFGFDAIIGLVPGVGDTITSLIALYPIWVAKRHGLGKALQARMAFNVFVDWLPGLVPVVGDLIDFFYRENLKNLKLLDRAVDNRVSEGG
jgi:hypothetical protein